jgi:hypothetical protein
VAFGNSAGYDMTSGVNNAFFGHNTGRGIITGSGNTIIGASISGLPATLTNNIILGAGGIERLRVDQNGNVGIGTTSPSKKLTIAENGATLRMETTSSPTGYYSELITNYNSAEKFALKIGNTKTFGNKLIANGQTQAYLSDYYGLAFLTATENTTAANVRMFINQSGNVGIGTTVPNQRLHVSEGYAQFDNGVIGNSAGLLLLGSPTSTLANSVFLSQNGSLGIGIQNGGFPSGYKLAVDGNIIAEKVKVKNSNAWPDFVFKKDYQLPSLSEIEKYVNENSHLPEIPSAEEIEKDGQDLGEMNRLLLKKVEELTLYIIQLEKRTVNLEKNKK